MADDTTTVDTDTATTTTADTTTADTKADTKTTSTADTGKTADTTTADTTTTATTDDWRSRVAGDDTKLNGFLGRFASEKDFVGKAKKLFDDEKGGKFLKPLGDDPSEADVKAYRTAMGVPEKAEGYLEKLSGGLVVGADDRPIVDKFLAAMHEKNARPADVDAALQSYYKIVEEQDANIATAVATAKAACEDALREEYGADYRRNTTAADSYLGTLPAELQSAINEGFNGAGIPLKNDANVMKWLVQLALDANPLATVVPGAGANQASAIAEEIAAIEKRMRTDRSGYNNDERMQSRYRELITAREKLPKD